MTPVRGRRLGIDVGAVRVGVAMCDPDGILATPVETVARDAEGGADVRRIADLVAEHDVVGIVLGLPRNLRGEDGPAAVAAREFAAALEAGLAAAGCAVPVELTDERMTTVVATRQLAGRGVRGRKQRSVIDQQAAVAILQGWLDTTRDG